MPSPDNPRKSANKLIGPCAHVEHASSVVDEECNGRMAKTCSPVAGVGRPHCSSLESMSCDLLCRTKRFFVSMETAATRTGEQAFLLHLMGASLNAQHDGCASGSYSDLWNSFNDLK